jgi:3-phosphoshikimate 1-carboxyvinyltransferase
LVEIRPPGSKSLTNRAILLAALANGSSVLSNALTQADDAQQMMRAVESLGASVRVEGQRLLIEGVDGRWQPKAIGDDAVGGYS